MRRKRICTPSKQVLQISHYLERTGTYIVRFKEVTVSTCHEEGETFWRAKILELRARLVDAETLWEKRLIEEELEIAGTKLKFCIIRQEDAKRI